MTRPDAPIYLTFDDGPDPIGTPLVLDALARHGAQATFFVLGEAVRRSPALVDDLLDAGHRVELHGDAHLDHRSASTEQLALDTTLAISTLAERGVTPSWWRLPWGRPGRATAPLACELGLRIAGWDLDTHDWRGDGWDQQPPAVRASSATGGVVLMHDGIGPGATRDQLTNTISLIDGIVAAARSAGTPLERLPDATAPWGVAISDRPGQTSDAPPAVEPIT